MLRLISRVIEWYRNRRRYKRFRKCMDDIAWCDEMIRWAKESDPES